jgi:hypothetical protein
MGDVLTTDTRTAGSALVAAIVSTHATDAMMPQNSTSTSVRNVWCVVGARANRGSGLKIAAFAVGVSSGGVKLEDSGKADRERENESS